MQPDEDRVRSGGGSFPPEDDALERHPGDEGIDDPDTERPARPFDPEQDADDEDDDEDYYAEE